VFLGSILGPGQRGPLVVDDRGDLVWFKPVPRGEVATDVRVQTHRGRPVLTWWQGRYRSGHGCGAGVIADASYRTVATVRPRGPGATCADLHEFLLTPRGTALMVAYPRARHEGRRVYDGTVMEVQVETGRVLFRWNAREHVAFDETYSRRPRRPGSPIDWFHINAVDTDGDGDLLVTARHTWGVYKIDGRSGRVLWRLGGRRGSFAVPRAGRFSWPHDARFLPDGTISVFDNAAGDAETGPQRESSAMVFRLDESRGTASLVRRHTHSPSVRSLSQANAQRLPNGSFFVGWGFVPYVSEHTADGRQVLDLRLPPRGGAYRAYRPRRDTRGRSRYGPRQLERFHGGGSLADPRWERSARPASGGRGGSHRLRDGGGAARGRHVRRGPGARPLKPIARRVDAVTGTLIHAASNCFP
jgi:arylsulfotransferase ASST